MQLNKTKTRSLGERIFFVANTIPYNSFSFVFNSASSSFWLGNEAVHQLTSQTGQTYRLRFEMLSTSGQWFSAEYDTFVVMDEATDNYRIWVSGFSGDCGDSMEYTGTLEKLK